MARGDWLRYQKKVGAVGGMRGGGISQRSLNKALKKLTRVNPDKASKIYGRAMRVSLKPGVAAVKRRAQSSKRTGALIAAIRPATSTKSAKAHSSVIGWIEVVGNKSGDPRRDNPAKYSHLVEFGTTHSTAKPFLKPGVEETADIMANLFARELSHGIATHMHRTVN